MYFDSFNLNVSSFQYNQKLKNPWSASHDCVNKCVSLYWVHEKVLIPKNLSYPISIKNLKIFLNDRRTKKKINCKNSYLANYCFPRYFCYRLDNYWWLENGWFHCWHWSDNKNFLLLFSWKNLEQDQMGYKKEMVVVILVFVQQFSSVGLISILTATPVWQD